METIIIHPQTEDELQVIKTFLKEHNIEFEKSHYDPNFVAKIKKGEKDLKEGKGISVNLEDIWK